ncbi:MAG: HupE/UreJ family protein, partial [Acidimicrobiia bacterium]|nr:HupE/UreJ family protein [Acidimicrobiia bacterium]
SPIIYRTGYSTDAWAWAQCLEHPYRRLIKMWGSEMKRRLVAEVLTAVLLLAVMLGVLASPAAAHDFDSAYLYVDVGEGQMGGRAELPYKDIRNTFGLELEGSRDELLAELEAHLPLILGYLEAHTAVGANGEKWIIEFANVDLFRDELRPDGGGYALFPFEVTVPDGKVPQLLEFTFDPFVDEAEDQVNLVLLRNDLRRGVIDQESLSLVVIDAGTRSATADLGGTSQWKNFTASVDLGVLHIQSGPDHILFIIVLLLPAVLVLRTVWRPAPSFSASLWRVLKVVSVFTVAHTITFTFAGLDILPLPPSRLVEVTIALSITAAALHNLWPVLRQREWIIAFVFGLFHGMGFASIVDTLDVGRTHQLISLLGRNIGIEIGQVVIVLVVFPALFLLSRTVHYRALFVAGSIGLATVSSVWAFERLVTVDVGMTRWVVRLVRWPRSLVLAIVASALIAVVYAYERRSDRLVALPEKAT